MFNNANILPGSETIIIFGNVHFLVSFTPRQLVSRILLYSRKKLCPRCCSSVHRDDEMTVTDSDSNGGKDAAGMDDDSECDKIHRKSLGTTG